eukprot:Pgem_evm1s3640
MGKAWSLFHDHDDYYVTVLGDRSKYIKCSHANFDHSLTVTKEKSEACRFRFEYKKRKLKALNFGSDLCLNIQGGGQQHKLTRIGLYECKHTGHAYDVPNFGKVKGLAWQGRTYWTWDGKHPDGQ